MQKTFHLFAAVLVVLGAITLVACIADPKVINGAFYAEHPKADILGSVQNNHTIAKVLCAENSKVRLIMVLDNTVFVDRAFVLKEQDIEIPNLMCGKELEEIKRLAEIGRKSENKPGS